MRITQWPAGRYKQRTLLCERVISYKLGYSAIAADFWLRVSNHRLFSQFLSAWLPGKKEPARYIEHIVNIISAVYYIHPR